jgi:hypothetical protein
MLSRVFLFLHGEIEVGQKTKQLRNRSRGLTDEVALHSWFGR